MKDMKRCNKQVRLLVLGLLALAILMTGCGSKKEADSEQQAIQKVDDLAGKKIGVQLGTTGDIYASDYEEEGSTVERFNKAADAVQALKLGKIDCIILDENPAKKFVETSGDLQILEEEFAVEEYAICISKKKYGTKREDQWCDCPDQRRRDAGSDR